MYARTVANLPASIGTHPLGLVALQRNSVIQGAARRKITIVGASSDLGEDLPRGSRVSRVRRADWAPAPKLPPPLPSISTSCWTAISCQFLPRVLNNAPEISGRASQRLVTVKLSSDAADTTILIRVACELPTSDGDLIRRIVCSTASNVPNRSYYDAMTRPRVPPDQRQRTAQACESCKRRKQKASQLFFVQTSFEVPQSEYTYINLCSVHLIYWRISIRPYHVVVDAILFSAVGVIFQQSFV